MTHQAAEVIIHRSDESTPKLSVPYDPTAIEKVHIFPTLKIHLSSAIAMEKVPMQSHFFSHDFQELKKELLSRKYSHKTVKAYICFNRDFLGFIDKCLDEINDGDIKDYLLYLAEEKNMPLQH